MQHVSVGRRLPILFLLLLFQPLTSADLGEVDKVPVEVIVDSSPCSTTCGLGVKTQILCLIKDCETVMEEGVGNKDGTEVSDECRVRKVKCLESWQCGLRTMTVTSGQRVEIDCLGEVMEAMGRFSWRVLWRYARGIISSDDSLFNRFVAPQLDRVILDPVREEDAGADRTGLCRRCSWTDSGPLLESEEETEPRRFDRWRVNLLKKIKTDLP
ncbi:transmembrane protein 81 isoform X2 [Trachinotus anak]|uniref:transmembrane protein 81 isoform X2 n=1 Tax=Trachinotus anak TaxID=443729 RepID=UPI0039F24675